MREEGKSESPEYPEGTVLAVLGHWMGRCAHSAGEIIVVGPGGMQESKTHPGYYEGRYTWWQLGREMGGSTTGLRVEPSDLDGPLIDGSDKLKKLCPTCSGLGYISADPRVAKLGGQECWNCHHRYGELCRKSIAAGPLPEERWCESWVHE